MKADPSILPLFEYVAAGQFHDLGGGKHQWRWAPGMVPPPAVMEQWQKHLDSKRDHSGKYSDKKKQKIQAVHHDNSPITGPSFAFYDHNGAQELAMDLDTLWRGILATKKRSRDGIPLYSLPSRHVGNRMLGRRINEQNLNRIVRRLRRDPQWTWRKELQRRGYQGKWATLQPGQSEYDVSAWAHSAPSRPLPAQSLEGFQFTEFANTYTQRRGSSPSQQASVELRRRASSSPPPVDVEEDIMSLYGGPPATSASTVMPLAGGMWKVRDANGRERVMKKGPDGQWREVKRLKIKLGKAPE